MVKYNLAISGPLSMGERFVFAEAIGEFNPNPNVIASVIVGSSRGVDQLAATWAKKNRVPIAQGFADFNLYGKFAMKVRNVDIANAADALLCLWDGVCPHTEHLFKTFYNKKKPYYIFMQDYICQ